MIEIEEMEVEDCVQPENRTENGQLRRLEQFICPVDEAARIIGQKWTLQIVHELLDHATRRFCELQEALGGVNPSTLSSRLKMLEEEGDALYHEAVEKLFSSTTDAIEVMKWKELYDKIEDAIDQCEDVGNTLQSIALKNA